MKFLVGYDGSDAAKAALEQACIYAKACGADIVAIASVKFGSVTYEFDIDNAEKHLEYAENVIKRKGISPETKVLTRGFSPGEDIVKFAGENDIQAVFIGIKKRSKLDKMLFGSNAQHIVLKAPCPVVTVK